MGDRALVIFHDKAKKEYSPVVYLHWQGHAVGELLGKLKILMEDRRDDVDYATARFIGFAHSAKVRSTDLGVWNLPGDFEDEVTYLGNLSHGDAGVFLAVRFTGNFRKRLGTNITQAHSKRLKKRGVFML